MFCQNAGLWQAVHALTNFHVRLTIGGDFAFQVVLFDDNVGGVSELEAQLFVPVHGCIQVEVLDADWCVSGLFGGDCTVEVQLESEQIDGWCAALPG